MKTKHFLFLLSLIAVSACKKITASSVTISADVDGVPTSFNTDAFAIKSADTGSYGLEIGGAHPAGSTSDQLTVGITGTAPVTMGIYDDVTSSAPDQASILFEHDPGANDYGASGTSPYTDTITITSISSTSIHGTFHGTLTLTSTPTTPTSHVITNGKFDVQW